MSKRYNRLAVLILLIASFLVLSWFVFQSDPIQGKEIHKKHIKIPNPSPLPPENL